MFDYTPIGNKVKKIDAYGVRMKRRAAPLRFHCYDSNCDVCASSHEDLERHQRAKQHGPFHPKTPRHNVTITQDGEAVAAQP